MIKHIVFFKLKENCQDSLQKAVDMLRGMEGQIPGLLSIEVGVDFVKSERSYDFALTTTFTDKEALDIYQDHEVHVPVKVFMREVCNSILAVDYEM